MPYKSKKDRYEWYNNWYATNGRNRASNYSEQAIEYSTRHSKEKAASSKLRYNVLNGSIKKPEICSSCGEERRLLGHHEDYEKPLEVVWLCHSCHKRLHNDKTQEALTSVGNV